MPVWAFRHVSTTHHHATSFLQLRLCLLILLPLAHSCPMVCILQSLALHLDTQPLAGDDCGHAPLQVHIALPMAESGTVLFIIVILSLNSYIQMYIYHSTHAN